MRVQGMNVRPLPYVNLSGHEEAASNHSASEGDRKSRNARCVIPRIATHPVITYPSEAPAPRRCYLGVFLPSGRADHTSLRLPLGTCMLAVLHRTH